MSVGQETVRIIRIYADDGRSYLRDTLRGGGRCERSRASTPEHGRFAQLM